MVDGKKVKDIINNRIVAIMAHGQSIKKLEENIEQFKDYDICWTSLNLFTIMEKYILDKINKRLEIIFDCSSIAESLIEEFETEVRLPRLENFLKRKRSNLWITSHGIIRDSLLGLKKNEFYEEFKHKIFEIDSIFPKDRIPHFMSVPNSIVLMIAAFMYGGAKKIIIFGLDGCIQEKNIVNTYYKKDLQRIERYKALGRVDCTDVSRDTNNFIKNFSTIYNEYKELFGDVEVINCSPDSIYTMIKNINYNELKGVLENG